MGKVIMSGIVEPLTKPIALPPVGTALEDMSWEQIRAISDAGKAANYFSVGDTKNIVINGKVGAETFSSLSIDVFILGIDHNSANEGAGRIHFAIGKIGGKLVGLADSKCGSAIGTIGLFSMNTSGTNTGGWASCHMRKTVLGSDSTPASPTANTLLAALPADLLAVLKPITKYSDNVGNASNTASDVTATTDYLPLLAEYEVRGKQAFANSAEQNYQVQYDYFKAGNSKIAYKHSAANTAVWWWLRSTNPFNKTYFCDVETDGSIIGTNAYTSLAVLSAFAV